MHTTAYTTNKYSLIMSNYSNPTVACTTTSAERCAKTSVSREADFAPNL